MKILILIPVYKRPEVFKVCLENLKWFASQVSWTIEVVCVLSPDDEDMKLNEKLVKKYGHKAVYWENLPVAEKMNAGLQWVCRNKDFDYLMNFGSDDLIHPEIEKLYAPLLAKKVKFFGINTLYFMDYATHKTFFFNTYNNTGSIGAGRMIHKSILDKFIFDDYPLYDPGLSQGLDCSSAMSIKRTLSEVDVIIDSGGFPYIVDIKTNTNINHITHIETRTQHITYFPDNHLNSYYPCLATKIGNS